jgi:Ala-tRNA(Pro) deacylase
MTTATKLTHYLSSHGVPYEELPHATTLTSLRTAQECHVPANRLAKAVVLEDDRGYLLAVLPASHHLRLAALERQRQQPLRLADEDALERLFPDCAPGAVPPIGAAYGIDTIVDESIAEQSDIFFEAGDHKTLLHVSGPVFRALMAGAQHGNFSTH